jgi:hypothetical protein
VPKDEEGFWKEGFFSALSNADFNAYACQETSKLVGAFKALNMLFVHKN